ncbi:MAG: DedA family protein [Phycisphaerales bacterium]
MELWHEFLRLFTGLDQALADLVRSYGAWTYAILFAIVFAETGLVVTPFLPGDSLLFAGGALCGLGGLNPFILGGLIFLAAFCGDMVNYHVGKAVGPRAFSGRFRWLKREHLDRTHAFFEKYGGKAVILARFVPIVRTFMPFVAGVGAMRFPRFVGFSVVGTALWVTLFVGAGYLFGNIPVIKSNFSKVVLAIIVLSVMPIVIEWWRARRGAKLANASKESA